MTTRRHKKTDRIVSAAAGADSRFECGTMSVDDPERAGSAIRVQANIRHDILVHWRARRQIDDVQFLAGQRLQALWYRASAGSLSTLRYDRDRVDGGVRADPFSEQAAAASAELREIAAFLGHADYRLVLRALCEGQAIEDLARDVEGREPHRYIARRLRDALSSLGGFWGTGGAGSAPKRRQPAGPECRPNPV